MQFKLNSTISARKIGLMAALCSAPFWITACNSGSNSSPATGTFSLAITDAPIDSATKVVVEFTGVSIKPASGEVVEFLFPEPRSIDLLQLQGSLSDSLVTDEQVVAGQYEWIRLHVNAVQDNIMDSYIEFDDGTQQELNIPSGAQTGLKLVSGFTVPAGGSADFTIDFDLRKSITSPPGMSAAILKPALRLVDNVLAGSILGTVDSNLVNAACADPTMSAGAVYVYTGADVTPVDMQGNEDDPIASALVNLLDGEYRYEVGFLLEGDYTIAYTCEAVNDDPATADEITFEESVTVPVMAGLPTAYDFVLNLE